MLKMQEVTKTFGDFTALNNLSMHVPKGAVYGLVGPNGAGKRLQPKTRWGINVCYHKGIVPIIKSGATVPSAQLTVKAVGSRG